MGGLWCQRAGLPGKWSQSGLLCPPREAPLLGGKTHQGIFGVCLHLGSCSHRACLPCGSALSSAIPTQRSPLCQRARLFCPDVPCLPRESRVPLTPLQEIPGPSSGPLHACKLGGTLGYCKTQGAKNRQQAPAWARTTSLGCVCVFGESGSVLDKPQVRYWWAQHVPLVLPLLFFPTGFWAWQSPQSPDAEGVSCPSQQLLYSQFTQ